MIMIMIRRGLPAVLAGILWFGASESQAQTGRRSVVPDPVLNPYMNPYANPYLNPAMTVGTVNRNDALVYMWAAQQQPGGLLGGRRANAKQPTRPAEMPNTLSLPARGASHYFGRPDPSVPGTGGRYQRFNRYYSSNGR